MAGELSYGPEAFPWTLYFNGRAMPKWAAMWHWWNYADALETLHQADSFSCEFTIEHIFWIQCRIDHVGVAESANVWEFKLATALMLNGLLRNEAVAVEQIRDAAKACRTDDDPRQIFADIRDGLLQMHRLATEDGLAFWTNGYENDRLNLVERIRRNQLPREHPDFLEAPHEVNSRSSYKFELAWLRKGLVKLTHEISLPKAVSRAIQSLAKTVDREC